MRCIIPDTLLAGLVAVLVGAGGLASQNPTTPPGAPPLPSPADTIVRPTGTLRTGDLIKLRIYRDSELSGQYLIDARGNVQIAGLGVIRAAGLDPTQLSDRLIDALRERGFRTPEIALQVLIRVSVLGEVRTPGLYTVDPGASLLELVTVAGGPTSKADLQHVSVIREAQVYHLNLQSALSGSAAGRVALYSNDVVFIPENHSVVTRENISFFATLASLALTIVTLFTLTHH
jgi:polysaccharide export outer membrane protein